MIWLRIALGAGLLALAACDEDPTGGAPDPGTTVRTDGSPEARQVAAWLSSGTSASSSAVEPVAPGAVLTMSDYGLPLTLANLRESGPDRIQGCALARVERSRTGVMATWSCTPEVELAHRQVEFDMKEGRIAAAHHVEAFQATQLP